MRKAKDSAGAAAMGGAVASGGSDSYDVFLSFRGDDTRLTIVELLLASLVRAGIRVFKDDEDLLVGGELLKVIAGAKICIPIFSKQYASNRWCLEELAAMVEIKVKSGGGKTIIPIFYDVEPRDVRLETPLYGDALVKHTMRRGSEGIISWENAVKGDDSGWEIGNQPGSERIKAWENALKEVGSLPGWEIGNRHRDYRIIEEIIEEVMLKLKANKGIDEQVEDMMDLLDLQVSDVRIVGIRGKDGVGKTTLAKVIYEKIFSQFDRRSFLADIGATAKQLGGVRLLQSKLMSDILNREYEVDQVAKGVDFFKGILRNMKVLIVLDDVVVPWELHKIFGEKLDWFGSGSRIIVTTRIESVFPKFISRGLAHVYGVNVMNSDQALELFRKHAMRRNLPIPDFDKFATGIINSVNVIPLLIEVIVSFLSRKVVEEWTALKEVILQPGPCIEKILMASYEELSKEQKEIFLDIACLPADVDCRVASFMWHNPNFSPSDGVDALHFLSLVKIGKNNELRMHRLLREFGQEIIQKEDDLDPGTRGRLCNLELARRPKRMEVQCLV